MERGQGRSNLRWLCWGAAGGALGSPGLGDRGPWGRGPPLARTLRRPGVPSGEGGSGGWPRRAPKAPVGPLLAQIHPLHLASHPLPSGLLFPHLHQVPLPHGQLLPQPAGPSVAHCSLSASGWSKGEEEGSREGWDNGGRDGGRNMGRLKGIGGGSTERSKTSIHIQAHIGLHILSQYWGGGGCNTWYYTTISWDWVLGKGWRATVHTWKYSVCVQGVNEGKL